MQIEHMAYSILGLQQKTRDPNSR